MAKKPYLTLIPGVERWDASHGTYLAGRSFIDGAQALAIEMEERWGADRLRLLVEPAMREKYDRQRVLWRKAIELGALEDVRRESARMVTALETLNRAAEAAGRQPIHARVWEVAMADGTVLAIVPDNDAARMVYRDGRRMVVYTLDELAHLMEAASIVTKAKVAIPGATVTRVSRSITDPLDGVRAPPNSFDDPLEDLWPEEGLA